jgi:LysR family transcriptional regulator, glycine cleavage system transcriptional activator
VFKNNILPRLDYLLAFEAAAITNSFSGASQALNISETAISRKVKLLEHHYKIKFFKRGHRSIQLTPGGQKFFDDISPLLEKLRTISTNLLENSLNTSVTIAATNSVAGLYLMPKLSQFSTRYEPVYINLLSSDDDNECLGEDVDLTILRGNGHWTGYAAELLFGETIFPVCSPEFLRKNPGITTLAAVSQSSLIGIQTTHTEWMNWRAWFDLMHHPVAEFEETVSLNTYPLAIEAAVNGLGIALGWAHLVDHLLEDNKLIRPLGNISARTDHGYYLLKASDGQSFPERDRVENWLLEVSASRQRYQQPNASTL